MNFSRSFYLFVCATATVFAVCVLVVGHFRLVAWLGIGLALIIIWAYGLNSRRWKGPSPKGQP